MVGLNGLACDMTCDLNCVAKEKPVYCCKNCADIRKGFVSDENRYLWNNRRGFLGPNGCKLKNDKPKECKEYDCKDYQFLISKQWIIDRWTEEVVYSRKFNWQSPCTWPEWIKEKTHKKGYLAKDPKGNSNEKEEDNISVR